MSIQTKLEGDDLKINIVDLLGSLSGEQEQQLIEQLSCSDTIIKHVTDQLIEGLTDGGHSGFIDCGGEATTPLSIAIRKVAKSSSELATKEIETLERSLSFSEKSKNEYMNKYLDLQQKIQKRGY